MWCVIVNSQIIQTCFFIIYGVWDLFCIYRDSHLGREFYVSGHTASSDVCDSFGWMMISTKSTCNYEKGDRKPSFYYASGLTQAHWGYSMYTTTSTTTTPPL